MVKRSKNTAKADKPAKVKPVKKTSTTEKTNSKRRNFVLLDTKNKEIGRYTGNAPRQAALKVANTGVTSIRLRETGIRRKVKDVTEVKIHIFKGSRKQRKKIASDPEWLPEKINYPVVKKVGVEWVPWSN